MRKFAYKGEILLSKLNYKKRAVEFWSHSEKTLIYLRDDIDSIFIESSQFFYEIFIIENCKLGILQNFYCLMLYDRRTKDHLLLSDFILPLIRKGIIL